MDSGGGSSATDPERERYGFVIDNGPANLFYRRSADVAEIFRSARRGGVSKLVSGQFSPIVQQVGFYNGFIEILVPDWCRLWSFILRARWP